MARNQFGTEYQGTGYYDEDRSKFIDIHNSIKISIESFLATILFKGDLSRIVYCKEDIAFRRRVELVDSANKDTTTIQPLSLQLPFACFSKSSEFDNDDTKGLIAPAALIGQYAENGWRLRNLPVKVTYDCTIFFARQDDLRFAQQVLYWEATPETPHWITPEVLYKDGSIFIPCFFKIKEIDTNPGYNEKEWLEKSRIFPMKVSIDVYSYELVIPNVSHIINLPARWGRYNNPEEDDIYVVEEAVLVWANEKFDLESKNELGELKPVESTDLLFKEHNYTREQVSELMETHIPNDSTIDIINGYFAESYDIQIDNWFVRDVTPTSCTIQININPQSKDAFEHLEILCPGRKKIVSKDIERTDYSFDDLQPNSIYDLKILAFTKEGVVSTFTLQVTTPNIPENEAPDENQTFKNDNIMIEDPDLYSKEPEEPVSSTESEISEEQEEPEEQEPPKKKKGNSLIGMTF